MKPRTPANSTRAATGVVAATAFAASLGFASAAPAPTTANARATALEWSACPGSGAAGLECAWLTRPMVHGSPTGPKVRLRVMRAPATGSPDERIGTIFFNPGGPGASGTQTLPAIAPTFAPEVRRRFDIATWDPRGIGQSRPALVGCELTQPVRPRTGPVNWRTVLGAWERRVAAANTRCLARYPRLLANMGSVDAARDLDALRLAVGDAKLTFWGMSYGTVIGATYAQMFPSRVRALVLDGNVDPNATLPGMARSASAPDAAFGFFIQAHPWLGPKFTRLRKALDRAPIRLPGNRYWDRWDLVDLTAASLTSEASWPGLEYLINIGYAAKFGSAAKRAAAVRILSGPDKQAPPINDNTGPFVGVFCADRPQRPGLGEMWNVTQDVVRHGPVLSPTIGITFVAACAGNTAPVTTPVPQPGIAGPSVPGIIANATRDPATPFGWAVNMSRAFPSMRMVGYVDGVHIIWNRTASACVDDPINRFVITGEQPVVDLACPFVAPPRVEQPPIG